MENPDFPDFPQEKPIAGGLFPTIWASAGILWKGFNP